MNGHHDDLPAEEPRTLLDRFLDALEREDVPLIVWPADDDEEGG